MHVTGDHRYHLPPPPHPHHYCFCFSEIAISPNSSVVNIYQKKGKEWSKIHELKEHSGRITGIDWAPESNRIVSCASDRNAYVWTLKDGVWKPTLVLVRINRAATCVKWSPLENKFALGSGAKLISVVFSTYIKEIEDKPGPTPWGAKMPFGEMLLENKDCGGWVHSVAFSPSGDSLAWVSHNSAISVADAKQGKEVTQLITEHLPLLSALYASETEIIAAGHDCCPYQFSYKGPGKLEFVRKLGISKQTSKNSMSAMQHFRNLDKKAKTDEEDNELNTLHQNSITQLCVVEGNKAKVEKFSSVSLDGAMVLWEIKNAPLPPQLQKRGPGSHYHSVTSYMEHHSKPKVTKLPKDVVYSKAPPHWSTHLVNNLAQKLRDTRSLRLASMPPHSEMQDQYRERSAPCDPLEPHYRPLKVRRRSHILANGADGQTHAAHVYFIQALHKRLNQSSVLLPEESTLSTAQAVHRRFSRSELEPFSASDAFLARGPLSQSATTLPKHQAPPTTPSQLHLHRLPVPVPHGGRSSVYKNSFSVPAPPPRSFTSCMAASAGTKCTEESGRSLLQHILNVPEMYNTENQTYGRGMTVLV
ncbi:Actin-related protein 2/3 complex subunit 1A [Bagarius yarrelli]|uniref:Actin-related protein 2/3 complex subunit 1A n=1 Tax=Bagarius yarrelli TaxID=175774 RepID=A0A556UZG4_BAGYA|nr:Actin-related protein 2/3 complex subunit 1A [Bagarius yarrelli]